MRQVFTSVRLENVERVEKMLNDAGIATKVNQGRSWKGVSRREFSYSNKNHDPSQQPSLWVISPEDFKKAREILFFCRQYTAQQALEMGLINAVVPLKDPQPSRTIGMVWRKTSPLARQLPHVADLIRVAGEGLRERQPG